MSSKEMNIILEFKIASLNYNQISSPSYSLPFPTAKLESYFYSSYGSDTIFLFN